MEIGAVVSIAKMASDWILHREKLEARLIPGRPNFGPSFVRISFRLINEGKRALEVMAVQGRFVYPGAEGRVFSVQQMALEHGPHVAPGQTGHNRVKLPFLTIGEKWREVMRNSDTIPKGELRLQVRFGQRTGWTAWEKARP